MSKNREKSLFLTALCLAALDVKFEKYTGTSFDELIVMMENGDWDRVEEVLKQTQEALKKEINQLIRVKNP